MASFELANMLHHDASPQRLSDVVISPDPMHIVHSQSLWLFTSSYNSTGNWLFAHNMTTAVLLCSFTAAEGLLVSRDRIYRGTEKNG